MGDRIFGGPLKCLSNMFVVATMNDHFSLIHNCENVFEDMITTGQGKHV